MNINMEVKLPDFDIVDFHLHLPIAQDDWLKPCRDEYIRDYGQEKWDILQEMSRQSTAEWLPDYCFPKPEKPDSDYIKVADRWYEEVKKYNIKRVVFQTGGANKILSEVVSRHKDVFSGFAHHYIEEQDAADKLYKAVKEQGLSGYKILAPVVKTPLGDKKFDRVFEVAHELELPVLIHFGILGGGGGIAGGANISPLAISEVAKRFPRAKFIVPHFGCGYVRELLQLCWASRNVYVDTSGNNLWIKWMPYPLTLEDLFSKFYETVGPERIIFGTDSEWFPRGFVARYYLDQLRACRQLRFSEAEIKYIFRDNALKLLKKS